MTNFLKIWLIDLIQSILSCMLHSQQQQILAWNLIQTKISFIDKVWKQNVNGVNSLAIFFFIFYDCSKQPLEHLCSL